MVDNKSLTMRHKTPTYFDMKLVAIRRFTQYVFRLYSNTEIQHSKFYLLRNL